MNRWAHSIIDEHLANRIYKRRKWYDNEPHITLTPEEKNKIHNQINAVLNPMTNEYMEYREIKKTDLRSTWEPMMSMELGRLSQG